MAQGRAAGHKQVWLGIAGAVGGGGGGGRRLPKLWSTSTGVGRGACRPGKGINPNRMKGVLA